MSGPFDQQNTPWPTVNNGVGALINPFGGVPDPNSPGTFWKQTLVGEPQPWLPYRADNQIGFFNRWYTTTALNGTANSEIINPISFDIPGFVYEITAAAITTTGAIPVNLDNMRNSFLVRFDYAQGDKLVTSPVLGDAACGDGRLAAKVGLSGWKFNRGSTMIVGITPLFANLRIDILFRFIEIRAGANFGSLG